MSPKRAADSQWWAKGFATIKTNFAEVLRGGPPPQIPEVDQLRLRALAQPRAYFAAIVAGRLARSLEEAPTITDKELEWIQKHYAYGLLEDLLTVKRAIHA